MKVTWFINELALILVVYSDEISAHELGYVRSACAYMGVGPRMFGRIKQLIEAWSQGSHIFELRPEYPASLSVIGGAFLLESIIWCTRIVRCPEFGGCPLFGSSNY